VFFGRVAFSIFAAPSGRDFVERLHLSRVGFRPGPDPRVNERAKRANPANPSRGSKGEPVTAPGPPSTVLKILKILKILKERCSLEERWSLARNRA